MYMYSGEETSILNNAERNFSGATAQATAVTPIVAQAPACTTVAALASKSGVLGVLVSAAQVRDLPYLIVLFEEPRTQLLTNKMPFVVLQRRHMSCISNHLPINKFK